MRENCPGLVIWPDPEHSDNRRGESPVLGLSSQDLKETWLQYPPLPALSWKASPRSLTAWQLRATIPGGLLGEALIFKAALVLSWARCRPRCFPAAAGMGGSAAGEPSDCRLAVGNGGNAKPRWVTWNQPTLGKASGLNCPSSKLRSAPRYSKYLSQGSQQHIKLRQNHHCHIPQNIYYHHYTIPGRLSTQNGGLSPPFSPKRKAIFHSLISLLVAFLKMKGNSGNCHEVTVVSDVYLE